MGSEDATTTPVIPQVLQQSSKPSGGLIKNTVSLTQDAGLPGKPQRRFATCIEFLMPICLLPFLFGNKEGISVYCALLTLAGLLGYLLPPPIAAMLPVAILPLSDVYGADQLAAEYLGHPVLVASLVFIIAIVADDTTVFFRLCLYALQRHALRMQVLFLYLQTLVLALSTVLPSAVIVTFSRFFIERFVTTVNNETICSYQQRSSIVFCPSIRARTDSLSTFHSLRNRAGSTGDTSRRGRSVSVVSDTTAASNGPISSDGSAGSEAVKRPRSLPVWLRRESLAPLGNYPVCSPYPVPAPKSRKTSFAPIDFSPSDSDPPHVPVRRIRSMSALAKPLPPILKSKLPPSPSATPPPTPHPPSTLPLETSRRGTFPMPGVLSLLSSPENDDSAAAAVGTTSPPAPSPSPGLSGSFSSPPEQEMFASHVTDGLQTGEVTPMCASRKLSSCSAIPEKWPHKTKWPGAVSLPSKKTRERGAGKRKLSPDAPSPLREYELSLRALKAFSDTEVLTAKDVHHLDPRIRQQDRRKGKTKPNSKGGSKPASDPVPPADHECKPAPHQNAEPQSQPEPKGEVKLEPQNEVKLEPQNEVQLEPQDEDKLEPKNEPARPELRGVLKKSRPSLQSGFVPRRDSAPIWWPPSLDTDPLYPEFTMAGLPAYSTASGDPRLSITPQPGASWTETKIPDGALGYYNGYEQQTSSSRVRALTTSVRPAFIVGVAYTAIFGNLINFNTVPTRQALLVMLQCRDKQCPVDWRSWFAVAIPVVIICSGLCWLVIYCSSLMSCVDEIDEQTHEDMSKCSRARRCSIKAPVVRDSLLFCCIVGIPLVITAYSSWDPNRPLDGPVFGLSVVAMSVVPASTLRHCWSQRMLSWRTVAARMPWHLILMMGSVMALTRTVETYRVVESVLGKVDDQFWKGRSTSANLFILVSVAAVLSEMLVSDSLAHMLAPVVIRVAVASKVPVSFYAVPVCLAASINLVLPVSLPILIMREYIDVKGGHMVAYGLLLKSVAVTVVFISMNTIGIMVFRDASSPHPSAIFHLSNVTRAHSAAL
ncbi:uncharacterized protein LOC144146251 [Haemaphysalis longicornis]